MTRVVSPARASAPSAPAATSGSSTISAGRGRVEEALAFWREEYELNVRIKRYPKPYRRADRRHRHGRRRRRLAARQPPGRGRPLRLRHAGGRHRLLPRRRRDLRPAALARRDRHLSRADRRAGPARRRRWRSGLRPTPSRRARCPALVEALAAGEPVDDVARRRRREEPGEAGARSASARRSTGASRPRASADDPGAARRARRPRSPPQAAATIAAKSPTSLAIAFEQMRRGADALLRGGDADRVPHRVADRARPRLLRGRARRRSSTRTARRAGGPPRSRRSTRRRSQAYFAPLRARAGVALDAGPPARAPADPLDVLRDRAQEPITRAPGPPCRPLEPDPRLVHARSWRCSGSPRGSCPGR